MEEKEETKKTKCELVGYDALPDYLKVNEFILCYYRCEWPLKETILSIFSIHNETLNVWTHLIGFLIFLSLAVITAMVIPRKVETSSPLQKNYYLGEVVGRNMTEGIFACLVLTTSSGELGYSKRSLYANNLSNPCIMGYPLLLHGSFRFSSSDAQVMRVSPPTGGDYIDQGHTLTILQGLCILDGETLISVDI